MNKEDFTQKLDTKEFTKAAELNAARIKAINDAMSWLASSNELTEANRRNAIMTAEHIAYTLGQYGESEIARHFCNLVNKL